MAHPDPSHPEDCFGCKIKSISWTFAYGREQFHGETIKERERQAVADAESVGIKPVNVGNRWI